MMLGWMIVVLQTVAMSQGDDHAPVEVSTVLELQEALAAKAGRIFLTPGHYAMGPEPLLLPAGTQLTTGGGVVWTVSEGTGQLLLMESNTLLSGIEMDARAATPGFVQDGLVVIPAGSENIRIQDLRITNCPRVCILTDNASDVAITDCQFTDVFGGIHLQFSRKCRIETNHIVRARHHGIQIWGNWNWEDRRSSDIVVRNNLVRDVGRFEGEEEECDRNGGGAIWAAGVDRLRFEGNLVDGATDVGLDMEWCTDSQIVGNVAKRARNACISLFFSCSQVVIEGNIVDNNWPFDPAPPEGYWTRAGIWLTTTNTEAFPDDKGHSSIRITGNVIHCEPGPARRALWLPNDTLPEVIIKDNILVGGGLWIADQLQESPLLDTSGEEPVATTPLMK